MFLAVLCNLKILYSTHSRNLIICQFILFFHKFIFSQNKHGFEKENKKSKVICNTYAQASSSKKKQESNMAKGASELASVRCRDQKCKIVESRKPHTINDGTFSAYQASPESRMLDSEKNRRIKPEDFDWNIHHPPSLADCCVKVLSCSFEKLKLLNEIPIENRRYLLEILPTDLRLDICASLIDYEHYWERRYNDEFGVITYPMRKDWNWKCIYLERHLRNFIEFAQPQYNDEYEMDEILTLLEPYVQTLRATQLQYWSPPSAMEKEDIPEIYPNDHIDFSPIFKKCQRIDEFDLMYGMNEVGENFEWRMFEISIADCERLGKAFLNLKLLKILRIRRSKIQDPHCQALVKGLLQNTSLEELDLSHCRIANQGALCIAKLIQVHPNLQILNLCDNLISGVGGEGIGFALLQADSCPLVSLDLRLNPLGHRGALGLMRSLVRGNKPEKLNSACCKFEDRTSCLFGDMLKLNKSLSWIDVSNNRFGESGGKHLVVGLSANESVKWLDVRATHISLEQLTAVKHLLKRNNKEKETD